MPSNADPSRTVVSVVTGNGSATQELSESLITGGALGGLVKFRARRSSRLSTSLVSLERRLRRPSMRSTRWARICWEIRRSTRRLVSFSRNCLHARCTNGHTQQEEHGKCGDLGQFSLPVSSNGANFYSNLTASDYRLTYDGTDYKVTRLSDNTSWTSGAMPITLDSEGISIDIGAGGMSTTDSFLIQPTHDVARNLSVNASVANDPRLLAAAAPVATAIGMTNTGTASISAATISVPDSSASYTAPADGSPVTFTYEVPPQNWMCPDWRAARSSM